MDFFDFESEFAEATTPTQASTTAPAKKGFSFGQFTSLLKKGTEIAHLGTQIAGQFSRPRTARAPTPAPQPAPAAPPPPVDVQPAAAAPADPPVAATPATAGPIPGQTAPGVDQIALLLQALQQRQSQPVAGPPAEFPAVMAPPAATSASAPAAPADGMALLRLILANPQFQQAVLGSAQQPGAAPPRAISLPVPASGHPQRTRSMQIPMGAVMNAIATIAGHSMAELNASTTEDEPEVPPYLVGEDGEFLVDPTSAEARAVLVTRWFLASEGVQRGRHNARRMSSGNQPDPSDAWAREAGFPM